MKRREFLAAGAGLLAGAALPGCDDHGASQMPQPPAATIGPDGKPRIPWQNWSGYRHCLPEARLAPGSIDELASFLKTTKTTVRPVGSGHSFTELVPTDGTLVSLRNFGGVTAHDATALTATIGAGTKLHDIGEPLHAVGQALPNMPDVDFQTLAGAIATGTHGTGERMGALHSYIKSFRLVTPRGEMLDCSAERNTEVFNAGRVSLGALGVITDYTLQNIPTHNLKRETWFEDLDVFIGHYDELLAKNYSLDANYISFSGKVGVVAINPSTDPVKPRGPDRDNEGLMELKAARDALGWWTGARRWLLRQAVSGRDEDAVDLWYKIFPSNREVRFNEMEYHLPREQLLPTLRKVVDVLETRHPEIFFTIEIRTVKGDDAWLSPFYQHDTSGSIAVHHYYKEDPLPYFADVEPLYQPIGGRPHWGKMNTLDASVFAQRYPRWKDFLAVRAELDPQGKMLNPYLKKAFGL